MTNSGSTLAYIGTPDSYFTKKFLPALQQFPNKHLKFVCVRPKEYSLIPAKSSVFLKFILHIKRINNYFKEKSSIMYWSVYCHQHQIQFEIIRNVNSTHVKDILEDCDMVLSAGIRNKLSAEILSAPKNGIVNFHYSLLPKYRGTNPVFWQKVNTDPKYGYTFHVMNASFDQGDILLQHEVSIESPVSSVQEICDQLIDHASNQLFKLLLQSSPKNIQNEIKELVYTNQDYRNYINIHSTDHGSQWVEKCKFSRLFVLNNRWIIHLEKCENNVPLNKLSLNGLFTKDSYTFKILKINYLPLVFYYFTFRKLF